MKNQKQKTREEILVGVLGDKDSAESTLSLADQRQSDYNNVRRMEQDASQALALLEAQVKFGNIELARKYYNIRHKAEYWTGGGVSFLMGIVSGAISAILDGAVTGISLVAPAVAFPLAVFVITLAQQTIVMTVPFSWTLAGQMTVVALWRALIVLIGTLAAIGVIMWWQNRVERQVASSYRNSYGGNK